jgi:hypothetical protein
VRMSREVVLDKIIAAFFDHEKRVGDALEELQAELARRDQEEEARLMQLAKDNPPKYGLARYEHATLLDAGGGYRPIMTPVEWVAVPEDELAEWAKVHSVKLADLWAVLRGDVRDLESKGQTWRAWDAPTWSLSKYYRDRSDQHADREELLQEDRDNAEYMRLRHEASKREAKSVPMFPPFSVFSSKKG